MTSETDALAVLTRLLQDPEAVKRSASAIVIAELAPDNEDVLEALRAAGARKDDPGLRRWVVEAIGAIAPPTVVQDLQPLITDRDRRVRSAVKHVLSTCKAVKESEIARMLDGEDEGERLAAIAVLGAFGTAKARKRLLERLAGASSKISSAIIDALRPGLADAGTRAIKGVVADLDGMLGSDSVEKDPDLAIAAIQLLGHTENDLAAAVLTRLAGLAVAEEGVRVSALETMQRFVRGRGHGKLFGELLDVASDDKTPDGVRAAVLNVLTNLDVSLQLEPRVRALATSERAPDRRWALTALGRLDTAPAAETLATAILEGTPDDREVALESASNTANGCAGLARLLGRVEDVERASDIARVLRTHTEGLAPDTVHALEQSVMEAPPEIGQLILDVLKRAGGEGGRDVQGDMLGKAVLLKNRGKYAEAMSMLRSLCKGHDADPEARFNLGICELKTSKRKISRGPNHDPCLETFAELLRHREFPLLERLLSDKVVEADDLFYVGFSFAERKDSEQSLGGDVLTHLSEGAGGDKLASRAHNKLKTMGWVE